MYTHTYMQVCICTDMCVCVRVYVHVPGFLAICLYIYARGDPRLASGVFLNHSILFSLRGSSVIPELAEKVSCQPVSSGESPSSAISVVDHMWTITLVRLFCSFGESALCSSHL